MKTLTGEAKQVFKKSLRLSRGLYKNNYPEIFGNKNRVEIPLSNLDYSESENYKIVKNYLEEKGYKITDYVGGYAQLQDDKNTLKIGKLVKDNNYVAEKFRDCEYRQRTKLILSRHPYDIACASYNQDWESCLVFGTGQCEEYLKRTLYTNMTIIAYHVGQTNNKVLGRTFIYPYWDEENCQHILKIAVVGYGLFPESVEDFLQDWIDKNYNEKIYKKISSNTLRCDFVFPNEMVYNNGERARYIMKNLSYFNDKINIRKSIEKRKLAKEISESLKDDTYATKKIGDHNNFSTVKGVLSDWINYHNSYGRNDKYFKEMNSLYCWLCDIPVKNNIDFYIEFISKYKLYFKTSDKMIQKYIITCDDPVSYMRKYIENLKEPIQWNEGKEEINLWAEEGYFKQNGVVHTRLLEKFV